MHGKSSVALIQLAWLSRELLEAPQEQEADFDFLPSAGASAYACANFDFLPSAGGAGLTPAFLRYEA